MISHALCKTRTQLGPSSSLDYKTKTGSTSSVTLTLALIKTEYWDRAGEGGNINYDWSGTSRMIHILMALDKVKSACK